MLLSPLHQLNTDYFNSLSTKTLHTALQVANCQVKFSSSHTMRTVRTLKSAHKAMMPKPIQMTMRYSPYMIATRRFQVNTMSAQDLRAKRQDLEAHRPIAPHFNIYKWPVEGLASGAQRATGFALVLGMTAYSQKNRVITNL